MKEYIKPTMLAVSTPSTRQIFAVSQPDAPWWDGECDVHEFMGDIDDDESTGTQKKGNLWDDEW
jgi:hypothetical protein